MALIDLAVAFNVVNPHNGANPHQNCMQCAVNTAQALVHGTAPVPVHGTGGAAVGGNGVPIIRTFDEDPNRAQDVLQYLSVNGPAGVYAVDGQDHAWNFIVLPNRRVYLVDSNQQIYRRIRGVGDFAATLHLATLAHALPFDYGDPEPNEEDGSELDFYHWGPLHPRWHVLLAQVGGQVWYNPIGGPPRRVLAWGRGSLTVD